MIIEAQKLVFPWQEKGVKLPKSFIVSDGNYYLPPYSVVKNDIIPHYWRWLMSLKLTRWNHKWDCDNFADSLKVFSAGYFHNSIESQADSLAIGTVYYMANSRTESGLKGAHAINILYYSDDGQKLNYAFIEPQIGSRIDLTEEEFNSIWVVYI